MSKHQYRIIDTCPCPKLVAPYFYIVLHDAGATATSIWRGDDPVGQALENKYGHHSQKQLCLATPAERAAWGIMGTPNHWGQSTHELKSDGRAYPRIPLGAELDWWMQGLDADGGDQAERCIHAAAKHDWKLWRPYDTEAELHHLNFLEEPKPHTPLMAARIIKLRATLPRS